MENLQNIENILKSLGYKTQMFSNYLMCNALYRNGDDVNSVAIYPEIAKDFVLGKSWRIGDFLQLVTNQASQEDLDKYLKNNDINLAQIDNTPKIKQPKSFDKNLLQYIDKSNQAYLVNRGISEQTGLLLESGYVSPKIAGKLKDRYVFPIFNTQKTEILGFVGRSVNNVDKKYKYLHFGQVANWVYPSHLNDKIIEQTKCVILVESIFCVAKLLDCGYRNVLCLFGVELKLGVLNYLLRKNIEKIIIATNNEMDSLNGGVGNEAAIKIKSKLNKYFDNRTSLIKLPAKKDFGEMDKTQIDKWVNGVKMVIGEKYFKYES
jgi:hypothetical protein